jgi:hypothetical protein
MQQPCGIFDAVQPFNLGTARVTPAQLYSRLVCSTAQAAVLNLATDMPGAGIIHPPLCTLSLEGLFRGFAADGLTGGLQRQIDLPDDSRLTRLIFATGLLLLIISCTRNQQAEREQFPHSGISGIDLNYA